MKKHLLFFLSIILVFASTQAAAAPVFEVDEPVFNFGSVPEGQKVRHTFFFRNKGDKDLKILDVFSGCSCTAASATDRLKPGEEGAIEVEMNTMGYSGMHFIQSVKLTTNDPQNKNPVLQLQGGVTSFANLDPAFIRLRGQVGEPISAEIHIRAIPEHPFRITSSHAKEGKDFSFEVFADPEGKNHLIRAINTRKTPGRYVGLITLEIESPIRKNVSVRVIGEIQPKGAKK